MKINPPVNRLIGDMPKVGIRPAIDGRRVAENARYQVPEVGRIIPNPPQQTARCGKRALPVERSPRSRNYGFWIPSFSISS